MASDPTNNVSSEPQSAGPAVSADQAKTNVKPGEVTGSTKIASIEDLRQKAPEVWKQMMIGIATTICKQMEKGQQRIKEAMRKAREVR